MNNFSLTVRKYILLWVFIAMVAGYFAGLYNPERVATLEFLLTPLAFLMIFIMVFPPNLSSLLKIKYYIYPLLVSFILFVASPLVAYTVSHIIPHNYNFLRTGIIISSTVPPNAMLSAWTSFLEGDIVLTLIIQSLTSLFAVFVMPFGLPLLFEEPQSLQASLLFHQLLYIRLLLCIKHLL